MYPKISDPQEWNVALYARLSKEDRKEDKNGNTKAALDNSESIANQLSMLNNYARQERLRVVGEYIDDGFSGGNYQRPAFERLITDIEAGKVNLVVTKEAYVKLKLKFCEKYFFLAYIRTALVGTSAVFTFIPSQIPKLSM